MTGETLENLREVIGYSQERLAAALGVQVELIVVGEQFGRNEIPESDWLEYALISIVQQEIDSGTNESLLMCHEIGIFKFKAYDNSILDAEFLSD